MTVQYGGQKGGSVNNVSVNCNVINLCDNQSTEGQFTCTWIDRNINRSHNVLTFNDNIKDQYCDFVMSGRGWFCLCKENAANGCIQDEYFGEVYDHVQCDFISILDHGDTDECWLVYLRGYGTFKNGFYSLYMFIWGFTSLSTLYRSYHDG